MIKGPGRLDANALNFSGGPGVLPARVLEELEEAIRSAPGVGLSILGVSHRSDWFAELVDQTERDLRALLRLPESHAVLFLQGGASLQFSLVPMHLLRSKEQTAEYLRTGYWSAKSISPAHLEGQVRVLWDGEGGGFHRLPRPHELKPAADAAYLHYVSNETVEGLQFHWIPGRDDVIRVCDMSSDFLAYPFDPTRFDLIYAHAQKNLGPAGVTLVLIRRALLERAPADLPAILDYRAHLQARSIYNTPPVFAIYAVSRVLRWLIEEIGDLDRMCERNRRKAERLYSVIDRYPELYRGWAAPEDRSLMNVVFRLATPEREAEFLRQATQAGFSGLQGHRALGGIRASIYNAMTLVAVEQLAEFMEEFAAKG
ncbi:phosphoserine transaminase [Caldichromatium japonicum]|uniref:Phosphoserine aminotransferase n=1 Tax=Caldichromatium japonicum TaxID=2699430 RepID=A0A6G7VGW0_9GAMM|nr:phosphoserine transaminase [Caldichromatium japonicum]QIK39182.1 phosphoserine transaminase [Caldichromatium japonicum]